MQFVSSICVSLSMKCLCDVLLTGARNSAQTIANIFGVAIKFAMSLLISNMELGPFGLFRFVFYVH